LNDSITNPPPTWAVTTLGDCATWYSGGTPSTSVATYWNGDIPWITASSLHDFYLRNSERKVTELGLQNGTRLMPSGTIIFVVRGMSLKSEFRVGIARRPVAFGQDCKAIVAKEGIDPLFLANVLRAKTAEVLRLVDEASHGTGRLQTDVLQNLEIPLPPFPVQHRIAQILGRLDDKIEVNRRINCTLEAMAQALYRHWFVEFGPFRDGEFVESELGAIPKGWETATLSDLVDIETNTIDPQSYRDETFYHYSIPAFDERQLPAVEPGAVVKSGKYLISSDRIMVSKLNPISYRIWTVFARSDRRSFSSTEFVHYISRSSSTWAFMNGFLRSQIFVEEFRSHVAGTTGSRQRVSPKVTLSFKVIKPTADVLREFEKLVNPYLRLQQQNVEENQRLVATRDYLLPKLLAGEIRIGLAEDIVGESALTA
jgi:type I restriction enzyme, S subunit